MNDYQVIAGVTTTLRTLLDDRMVLTAPTLPPSRRVTITSSHPDVKPQTTPSGPRLNLFLYNIEHSPYLRNEPLPGPRRTGVPPLGLELRYLVTCFPLIEEDDETMQIVLGDALQVLHTIPVLTDTLVRTRGLGAGEPILSEALRGSPEPIKLSFEPQSFAAAREVWSAVDKPYRLSFAFTASSVRIDSLMVQPEPELVRERQILLEQQRGRPE